jgi:hypothetical protein
MITTHTAHYGVVKTKMNSQYQTEYYNQVSTNPIFYCNLCKHYFNLGTPHEHKNPNAATTGL